jgi:hypothetical protein
LLSATAGAAEPAVTDEALARADDDRRAAAVLAALGEQAGEFKTVSSWSTVIAGVALTTTGILVDSRYDASYGPTFWITGVALIANGLTSLLVRPPTVLDGGRAPAASAGAGAATCSIARVGHSRRVAPQREARCAVRQRQPKRSTRLDRA